MKESHKVRARKTMCRASQNKLCETWCKGFPELSMSGNPVLFWIEAIQLYLEFNFLFLVGIHPCFRPKQNPQTKGNVKAGFGRLNPQPNMYSTATFGWVKQKARFHFEQGLASLHSNGLNWGVMKIMTFFSSFTRSMQIHLYQINT